MVEIELDDLIVSIISGQHHFNSDVVRPRCLDISDTGDDAHESDLGATLIPTPTSTHLSRLKSRP